MAEQLTFDLPAGVALTAGDFFVSEANAAAYVLVTHVDSWPERKLVLTGPEGSGKSHLARVFATNEDALIIPAATLTGEMTRPKRPVVIEDIEHLTASGETAMFHLHNHMRDIELPLLITARNAPSRWNIALPDLASRMQAATTTVIGDPDDDLLTAIIMKLFADRQIMPSPKLPSYLTLRIERSFRAAAEIVAAMDTAALTNKRDVNEKLAGQVLAQVEAEV
jgi:chromosomal replication initiation ATPase DnaA